MPTFASVNPTEEQLKSMTEFRNQFARLAEEITFRVPDGRERSLTITKLEEASMWLNKAIVSAK